MAAKKVNSNTLRAIFKRKGNESEKTKIIYNKNDITDIKLESFLTKEEEGVLIFYENETYWVLITDKRLIVWKNDKLHKFEYSNFKKVTLPLTLEYRNGITDKNSFSNLLLFDKDGGQFYLKLDKGKSFDGFYQVLRFVINRN